MEDLSPEKGEILTSFTCGATREFEWKRSLIGSFETVNKESTTNHLIIKREPAELSLYKQEPEVYETLTSECKTSTSTTDHLEERLNLGVWEYIGLQAPDTITFNEGVEIHAPCIP